MRAYLCSSKYLPVKEARFTVNLEGFFFFSVSVLLEVGLEVVGGTE